MKSMLWKPLSYACRTTIWSSCAPVIKPGLTGGFLLQQSRGLNKRKTKKVPPTKPLSFSNSGDLLQEPYPLDGAQPRLGYELCDELKSASEKVQKIFSVEFADGRTRQLQRIAEIQKRIASAPNPVGPLELRIAMKTAAIRNSITHCLHYRKDKRAKVRLLQTIQARNRDMCKLRDLDLANFEYMRETLELEHKPFIEYQFNLSRAATRKKEARDTAIAVYKARMQQLKEKLEEEKESFYKWKEEEFKSIAQELKELGADDVSDLPTALKQLNMWPINPYPPRKGTRRQQLLEHKFKLYGEKYKEDQV